MRQIPTSRITDLALGHLSPEASLKLLEEIEKSDELSEQFELMSPKVGRRFLVSAEVIEKRMQVEGIPPIL